MPGLPPKVYAYGYASISAPRAPPTYPALMIRPTLAVHCSWEDEMVRERIGHQPSFGEVKNTKSL